MSSEDFKSLIVTDPDLVDEGIDVSGLKTTTDTSPFLLGNIPDYSGIQYDYLGPTKYSDLMRLYSQGLPTIDTSQPATPPSGGGGGGSGDGGGTTPTQPDSIGGFNPGVVPGPSGFIGLDPDMDIDIKDYDDYQNYEPETYQGTPGGNTGSGYFDLIDNSGQDYGPYSQSTMPQGSPSQLNPLANEQFVGTDSGLDDVDMNAIDNPFAGTPVSTPSGNNHTKWKQSFWLSRS